MRGRSWTYSALALSLLAVTASQAALPGSKDLPVLLEANELGYDREKNLIVALGEVEATQGDRIVLADRITYSPNTNIVKAEGNVSVLEPTGQVYFANEVELKDDLKRGIVRNFRVRFPDNSVFAANAAVRVNDHVTQLEKAVYSPCKICEGLDPLWQVKAKEVTLNEETQRVAYEDAYFEVYGVPVLYTPYLTHAAPGADNKSGFMIPRYSQSSNLGTVIETPYYIVFNPSMDATLRPIYTSKEGPVLAGEYRFLTDSGEFEFEASATNPRKRDELGNETDGHEFRGHFRGKGSSRISDILTWGLDINRATDDTYLRRYDFGDEDLLTSRLYLEGIDGRNYGILQTIAFQGLRVGDDPSLSPFIAPLADIYYETDPGFANSRFSLSGNAMALTRDLGSETRRLSVTGGVNVPYVTEGGQIIEAGASLRSDIYSVDDVARTGQSPFDGTQGRVIPQASLFWRYPFVKQFDGNASLIVEPVAGVVASTTGNNPEEIPNEDSQTQEFSDANLFSTDRFSGLDRVESGTRISYGVRAQLQLAGQKNIHVVFGQGHDTDRDNPFPTSAAPDNHFSDYVGRVMVNIAPVDLSYRFQLDRDNFSTRRNEVNTLFTLSPVSLSANYISLDAAQFPEEKEEALLGGSLKLNRNWTFLASGRRDLTEGGGMLAAGSGLVFQNECVTVNTTVNRQFTRDRDIEPETSFTVRLFLKNLN